MRSRLDIRYRLAAHVAALVVFILAYIAVDPSALESREKPPARMTKTPPPAAPKTDPEPDTASKAMPADRPTPAPIPPPAAIPLAPAIFEPAPGKPANIPEIQPPAPVAPPVAPVVEQPDAQPPQPAVEPAVEPIPAKEPEPAAETQTAPPDAPSSDAGAAQAATEPEAAVPPVPAEQPVEPPAEDAATGKPGDETPPPAAPAPSDAPEPDRPVEPAEDAPVAPTPPEPEVPSPATDEPPPDTPTQTIADAEAITGIESRPDETPAPPAPEPEPEPTVDAAVPPGGEPAAQQPDESGALVVAIDEAAERAADAVPIPDTRFETLDNGVYWFSDQEDAKNNLGRLPADTRILVLAPNRESDPPGFGDHAVYSLSAAIPDLGYEAAAEFLDLARKQSDGPLAAVASPEAEAAAFYKGAYLMVAKDARLDAALLEIAPGIETAPTRDDVVRLLSRLDVESLRREFR